MAPINPKITIKSVYFGMLLLSAAVMVLAARLTTASELDSLKTAAEQGDTTAQLNLGVMYGEGEGEGVPQNYTEAVRWSADAVSAADDAPGEEDIARAIGIWLPSYLSIERIDILVTVNDGDGINPKFRQRFVAEVVPREILYSEPTQNLDLKPYIMLIETRTPQQPHKLYGVASSALVLGKWNLKLRMENGIDGLGRPVAMYSQPVIIIGSEDAERAIENLNAVKTLNKTLAEQAIRVEADAAILRAAADEELELLRNENRRHLEAIAAFNKYAPQIRQKVTKNWDQVTQKSLQTGVIVEIDRSGGVQSVSITEPSGSNEFDRSVSLAIRKASPLPIPDNADYYEYIRKFRFVFDSSHQSK